jgi:cobalt/nickel transport system permease protein
MKHDFIDKYSGLDSVLHRMDPRVKLFLSLCFLVVITATYNLKVFLLYLAVVVILLFVSKVPLLFYIKKLFVVTPLAVLIAFFVILSYILENKVEVSIESITGYYPVLYTVVLLVSKIYLSILVLTLLVSTTSFNGLLWSLRKYRLPLIVTTLSKLVYTYVFVFIDELHRTLRAYKSRTPVLRISRIKVYGNIAAAIFLRSMDRSDLIYRAMVSRGFTGEFPEGNTNRLKVIDFVALLCFLAVIAAARILWKI